MILLSLYDILLIIKQLYIEFMTMLSKLFINYNKRNSKERYVKYALCFYSCITVLMIIPMIIEKKKHSANVNYYDYEENYDYDSHDKSYGKNIKSFFFTSLVSSVIINSTLISAALFFSIQKLSNDGVIGALDTKEIMGIACGTGLIASLIFTAIFGKLIHYVRINKKFDEASLKKYISGEEISNQTFDETYDKNQIYADELSLEDEENKNINLYSVMDTMFLTPPGALIGVIALGVEKFVDMCKKNHGKK